MAQVIEKETAKKLEQLGIKRESLVKYKNDSNKPEVLKNQPKIDLDTANKLNLLTTAKKLKKLGIRKKSTFHYNIPPPFVFIWDEEDYSERYPAYMLAEILEMLPDIIETDNYTSTWELQLIKTTRYDKTFYIVKYKGILLKNSSAFLCKKTHKNPAEAAGQLLLWCIEQGYVKVEEVNNEMA